MRLKSAGSEHDHRRLKASPPPLHDHNLDSFQLGSWGEDAEPRPPLDKGHQSKTTLTLLPKAFQACRLFGAKLVIAKLDRLSRDAHFLLGLEKAGVDFVAAAMPHANRLTVGIMAIVADEERRMI
jgi:hypothetical protein